MYKHIVFSFMLYSCHLLAQEVALPEFETLLSSPWKIHQEFRTVGKSSVKPSKNSTKKKLRKKDGAYGFRYDVQLPKGQLLVLIPAPGKTRVNAYYEMVIARKIPLLITLCSRYEKENQVPFWEPDIAESLSLAHGWRIKHDQTLVLYEEKGASLPARIVERVYTAFKGAKRHIMHHLHYENWQDHKLVNPEALEALLKRRNEIVHSTEVPIVINCKGGKGRTGTLAIIDYCRKYIEHKLLEGYSIDEIRLDIPRIILEMRKVRPRIGSNKSQFKQVYQIMHEHYKKLKSES